MLQCSIQRNRYLRCYCICNVCFRLPFPLRYLIYFFLTAIQSDDSSVAFKQTTKVSATLRRAIKLAVTRVEANQCNNRPFCVIFGELTLGVSKNWTSLFLRQSKQGEPQDSLVAPRPSSSQNCSKIHPFISGDLLISAMFERIRR